jgi:putative salt-induced outer membrane protein YdiY
VAAGLLAGVPALRAQQALTLVNGDRLSGTLRRIADTVWVFAYRGTDVRVPVDSVASFVAPQPIGVRLADGTIAAAMVTPAREARALEVALADGARRIIAPHELNAVGPADHLAALVPVTIGWFSPLHRFWSGSGSIGFSDQRGNTQALGLALSVEVRRKTARDREDLGFGVSREQGRVAGAGLETTASKGYAFLQVDVYFSRRWFGTATTRQERDRFQDLALRSTYTAGLGFQVVSTAPLDLRVNASAGLRREDYFTAPTMSVPILGAGIAYAGELGPVRVAARVDGSPNAGDLADYRIRSNARATARLYKGLGTRIETLVEYNSRPLPGIQPYDVQTRLTLTYAFGR